MYSFNFDYIFNAAYNLLLAIRYAILFWILRISPADYIHDHQYDSYDGLIARGWIKVANETTQNSTIYLGDISSSSHWWQNIFGGNANFSAQQVNNDPWFRNLKLSIQNPILAFCADVVSVIAFFAMMFLIYTMFRWFIRTVSPIKEKKEKAKKEKIDAKKAVKEKAWFEAEEKRIAGIEKERVREIPIQQEKIEKIIEPEIPAGIPGLPIEEIDLSVEEKEYIEKENNLLSNYVPKNDLNKRSNKVIKIEVPQKEKTLNLREERFNEMKNNEYQNRLRNYKEKWNIVVNYMEGKEEALWRIGILEADNLLDEILADRGYAGINVADKLKVASFNTIDLAWSAHKMRNRIAHDGSKFVLTDRMARNTFELFRSIFTEFKIFE